MVVNLEKVSFLFTEGLVAHDPYIIPAIILVDPFIQVFIQAIRFSIQKIEFCDVLTNLLRINKYNKIKCEDATYTCTRIFPHYQKLESEHFQIKLEVLRDTAESARITSIVTVSCFKKFAPVDDLDQTAIKDRIPIKIEIASVTDFRAITIVFVLEAIKMACTNADFFSLSATKNTKSIKVLLPVDHKASEEEKKRDVASIINRYRHKNDLQKYKCIFLQIFVT